MIANSRASLQGIIDRNYPTPRNLGKLRLDTSLSEGSLLLVPMVFIKV